MLLDIVFSVPNRRPRAHPTLASDALRDGYRLHRCVFGLVNELAAHSPRCEMVGVNINPTLFAAYAAGAFFVLLFLSADHNSVGLNFPVGVGRCSAVTPLAADLDVLVTLELGWGFDFFALLNTGF
jgi:hypothetical protein